MCEFHHISSNTKRSFNSLCSFVSPHCTCDFPQCPLGSKEKIKVCQEALNEMRLSVLKRDLLPRQDSSICSHKAQRHPIILWVWHVPSSAFLPLCPPAGVGLLNGVWREEGRGGEGAGNEEGCGTVSWLAFEKKRVRRSKEEEG